MSDTIRISPEEFQDAVVKALAEYGDRVNTKLVSIQKDIARQAVSELKSTAPAGGSYAKGWTHRGTKGAVFNIVGQTIYNRTDYMLTHLMEYPHDTGGGGSYPKYVDYTGTLARIEDEYTQRYMEEVISKL